MLVLLKNVKNDFGNRNQENRGNGGSGIWGKKAASSSGGDGDGCGWKGGRTW